MSTATIETQPTPTATAAGAKPRVFSGIKPTGPLQLGNYLGAIRRWVADQDRYDNLFCVVDLHAITVPQDPAALRERTREIAAFYLAAGLDPERTTIFVQSHVGAHAALAWVLDCCAPLGWLERMTQYKDKVARGGAERTSVGFFNYPVLMAADILVHDTNYVPVGEDQKQHVELARDLAVRFNGRYGPLFTVPEPLIGAVGARIMSLTNPTRKMEKSDPAGTIDLLAPPDVIRQRVMRAVTDSGREVRFDGAGPGLVNLLTIYQLLSGEGRDAIEARFAGKGYGDLKRELADLLVETLRPLQARYAAIRRDPAYLDGLLRRNAARVAPRAYAKLARVKEAVGMTNDECRMTNSSQPSAISNQEHG